MTKQEIFETVILHLIKQGRPALLEAATKSSMTGKPIATCAYRQVKGEQTCKCAVGAMIPDEVYHGNMECKAVDILLTVTRANMVDWQRKFNQWLDANPWFEENKFFLARLQRVHDALENWISKETFLAAVDGVVKDAELIYGIELNLDFLNGVEVNLEKDIYTIGYF